MNEIPRSNDDGQISLLILGFTTMCVALVLVFVAASSVHLQHKRLLDTADAVAADAADAIDTRAYFGRDGIREVPVTDASVRSSVNSLLDRKPSVRGCSGLRAVAPTRVTAQGEVVVSLRCTAHPAYAGGLNGAIALTVPLQVTTQARARTTN